MSKRSIIYMAASILLLGYIIYAVFATRMVRDADHYTGVRISVADVDSTGFVTAADVDRMLGGIRKKVAEQTRAQINTRALLLDLLAQPTVEKASVVALNNGVLEIDVEPLRPVARVFDGRRSYYYNAAGKRVLSTAGHYVDVPVVYGHIADSTKVVQLLPMFDFIRSNPAYDALVTAVSVDRRGDIIVIPTVDGHVINLGDTSQMNSKFSRIAEFYHKVMPVKGWQYYDTVSVKWRGRIVATKRTKKEIRHLDLTELDGIEEELVDDGTMLTDARADEMANQGRILNEDRPAQPVAAQKQNNP